MSESLLTSLGCYLFAHNSSDFQGAYIPWLLTIVRFLGTPLEFDKSRHLGGTMRWAVRRLNIS